MLSSLSSCQAQNKGYKSLSADDYEKAIADTAVIRLDVRTAEEFANGHIRGAINIDVLKSDFEQKAAATLPKSKTIAVNCRSGKRSKTVRHWYFLFRPPKKPTANGGTDSVVIYP